MASFDRILALLKSTKIYTYSEDSLVIAEMNAYAKAFDVFFGKMQDMINNCYYDVVMGKYRRNFYQMYGLAAADHHAKDEKEECIRKIDFIKKRLSITNKDFDEAGIKKCLESHGFVVELVEDIANTKITVIVKVDYYSASRNSLDRYMLILKCLPYHSKFALIIDT